MGNGAAHLREVIEFFDDFTNALGLEDNEKKLLFGIMEGGTSDDATVEQETQHESMHADSQQVEHGTSEPDEQPAASVREDQTQDEDVACKAKQGDQKNHEQEPEEDEDVWQ